MFIMHATRKLWTWLAVICALSFAVLGWVGTEIYLTAPPIPKQVSSTEGKVLFSEGQVQRGQEAWLSAGGQQRARFGATAAMSPRTGQPTGCTARRWPCAPSGPSRISNDRLKQLSVGQRAELNARLKVEMRRNTYDAQTGTLTLSPERFEAVQQVVQHYMGLFGNDPSLDKLREQYAMSAGSLPDPLDLQALPAFMFWSSWSATATDRARRNGSELHQQLAPQAAGGRYRHRRCRYLVNCQHHLHDCCDCWHVVLSFNAKRRKRPQAAQDRPAV